MWIELTKQAHTDNILDRDLNLRSIMENWTLKKGYPLVNVVRLVTLPPIHTLNIKVTQNMFTLNSFGEKQTHEWFVPFTYTTKMNLSFDFKV